MTKYNLNNFYKLINTQIPYDTSMWYDIIIVTVNNDDYSKIIKYARDEIW